jgi:ABC-type bacteriocin/lantibiotic exporter with double-glycine peptidase domain
MSIDANLISYLLPIKKFYALLKPSKKDVFLLYGYAVFSGLINLSLPLGIQSIVGFIMGAQMSFSLYLLIALVLLGMFFSGFLQIMQMWLSESIQQRIFVKTAFDFADRIPRFKNENLLKKYLPEVVNKFFDSVAIQKGINKILIDFTSAIFQVFFGLLLLSFYHPFFVFFGIFLILFLVVLIRITFPAGLRTSLQESNMKYKVVFWLEEIARNQKLFKINKQGNLPIKKTDYVVSKWIHERKDHFKVLVQQYWFLVGFKLLVTGGLLIIGTNLIFTEQINIGQFIASEIIIILVINAVEKLIMSLEAIYDVATSAEKLDQALSIETDKESGQPIVAKNNKIDISIQNLSVKSKLYDIKILKNISLEVFGGERICLAGKGGSGKTTLASVMTGLMSEYEGNILFNDVPLSKIQLKDFYQYVSADFNNNNIFHGTIVENLTLGNESISKQEIKDVLEKCNLLSFVNSLPEGIDTILYPNDELLSSSVIKKLEVARNLLLKPSIMIVEDFEGSLSKSDETQMMNLLLDESNQWTLVFISNKIEFAKKCQRLVFMDKGEILLDDHYEQIKNKAEIIENLI